MGHNQNWWMTAAKNEDSLYKYLYLPPYSSLTLSIPTTKYFSPHVLMNWLIELVDYG
uniref:Uncharacterized protein n=1 Tax=Aster yellows phytoplasma TaxID=35779 RepID=Q847U2_ASTYP|nr:hypothetical protein [Aster yellows phytoplasma]